MKPARLGWLLLPLAAVFCVAAESRSLSGMETPGMRPPAAAELFLGRLKQALTEISDAPVRTQKSGETIFFESAELPTRAGNLAFAGHFIIDPAGRAFEGALERFSLSGGRIQLNLKKPARIRCAPDGTLSENRWVDLSLKGDNLLLYRSEEIRLGGDVNFTRLTLGSRVFFRIADAAVLCLRYDTGLIIPGRDDLTVPPAERFFNGGENTVRSFKEFKLGPRDSSGKPTGGNGYNVLGAELRHRLIGNFTGSIFVDMGNVSPNRTRSAEGESAYRSRGQVISDTLSDFLRGFRPAVGCGLQYQLPIGPVRVDVGFNPDRERSRDEDLYVVHLSIGMAF